MARMHVDFNGQQAAPIQESFYIKPADPIQPPALHPPPSTFHLFTLKPHAQPDPAPLFVDIDHFYVHHLSYRDHVHGVFDIFMGQL